MAEPAQVFIVGAGPGHPGLMTLRAVECLAQADVVIHDKLVPPALLDHAPLAARRICVADLSAAHCDRYRPVRETLVREARAGNRVVRLKGGDPFIFGRGGEEVEYLREQGIAYEIVPGVTSAIGAAACAGIPLTHRDHASAVVFVTGHEQPVKPEAAVDWPLLAKLPATLVIYMGLSRLAYIANTLVQHGKDPAAPAAAIHWGTTGGQINVEAALSELPEAVRRAGIQSPALIVIGSVVNLRTKLAWFERRPLFGCRVLVTRPRRQARDLAHRLELLGAVPLILPVVDIRPLEDWSEVDRALNELASLDWLVFTSANGVSAFLDRLLESGKDVRSLGHLKLAAIGPKTAEALQEYHLRADLVPATYRSEELAEALRPDVAGKRVLLARADRGRDVLPKQLAEVADVQQLTVYRQVDVPAGDGHELDCLRRGEIEFVTLTSPSIARAFLGCLDDVCRQRIASGEVKLVTISPVTSAEVQKAGLPVAGEAAPFTTEGVIQAVIDLAAADVRRKERP
jgi:uroporphyrinogen III methyltransferase/synthase